MRTINVEELIGCVKGAYSTGRTLMVWGSPGIGKSDGIHQACSELAQSLGLAGVRQYGQMTQDCFGLVDVRLSQCDPVDIGGLPASDESKTVQRRLVPDWFPSIYRDDLPEYGLVLLEELVSAPQSVQAAAYQLAHDKRIGDHPMKPGWQVVCTGNYMTDGGVVHKLATPLANRGLHVNVQSNFDSWCRWAVSHGVEPELLAFIRFEPDLLNTFEDHVKNKREGYAFATERTWHMVDDLLKADLDEGARSVLITGAVGEGPAAKFNAFRQTWKEMPSLDGIILDPHNAPIPQEVGTCFAVCTGLGARATEDNIGNILTYINRFSRKEFQALTVQDAMRRNWKLMSTPEFCKWATEFGEYLQ